MNRPVHGGNLAWAAAIANCPASSIVDFSASINPLGPPSSAIAAIQRGFELLNAYPDPNYSQLRSALADWHGISPEYLLPGNGSAELLTWACRELAQLESTYLITPAFSDYRRGLKAFGAKVLDCPFTCHTECNGMERSIWEDSSLSQNDSLKLREDSSSPQNDSLESRGDSSLPQNDSLESRGDSSLPQNDSLQNILKISGFSSASCGLLVNNPHNPTGKLWSKEEILPLLDKFALVLVDEAFMDFLPRSQQQSLMPYVTEFNNLVILRSLTKFYSLPGLRLGYAIASPDRLKLWQQWRDPWTVNILAAVAAEAIISDREFQEKTLNWLPVAREELFLGLSAIEGLQPLPSAANFLLVKTKKSSTELQEKLLKNHRILIRDCISFPELGDRYFRVAVRSQSDNQRLVKALKVIVKDD